METNNQLLNYLEQRIKLLKSDLVFIGERTNLKSFKKGETIMRNSEIERNLYFIQTGIVRLFYEREDRDITFNLNYALRVK